MDRRVLLTLVLIGSARIAAGQDLPLLPPPRQLPPTTAPEPRSNAPAEPVSQLPPYIPMVEKEFCATEVHTVERQELKLVPNVVPREVISRIPACDVEVTYKEEKRTVVVPVLKAREIDQMMISETLVPETSFDCNGCPHTEYKPVPCCKMIKVEVFEQVPEKREYTVKVPVIRPVNKEILVRRFVLDKTPQPAIIRKFDLIVIPIKAKVPIPTCPPPAACGCEVSP